jgi:hypothetical protein
MTFHLLISIFTTGYIGHRGKIWEGKKLAVAEFWGPFFSLSATKASYLCQAAIVGPSRNTPVPSRVDTIHVAGI